jgi:hypothetical protein
MAQLGALTVNLEANIAKFVSDMGKSSQATEQAMSRINGAVNTVKGGLAALGVGVSAGAFASIIKGSIDAADNLRDMAQKTGIAVEELNGLGFASGQAGGSLEAMVGAAGKLNKSLAEAASGNKDASAAFKALGISVTDTQGNLKKADVVMAEVADQFEKYQDGPEKAALALRLFGKAGAEMIPLLNDGGAAMRENIEYAKRYSYQTTDLSNAADNFNDTMGKLEIQQRGFINQMSAEMLPVLQSVANAFLSASEKANDLHSWSGKLSGALTSLTSYAVTGAFWFEQWGIQLGTVADKAKALKNLDFHGYQLADERGDKALATSNGNYQVLRDEIRSGGVKDRFAKPLSTAEAMMSQERDILAARNAMLNKYQGDGLISLKETNAGKEAAQAEYVKNMKGLYGAEIVILGEAKKFAKTPEEAKGIQDRIDGLYKTQSLVGTDKPTAPKLPGSDGDQIARALLAGQIKAMENAYVQSRDIAAFQNDYMGELRAQDLVDVQTYEQFKLDAIASSAKAAAKHYDEEIAALTKARDATTDAAAKAQISSQIEDKVAQKKKAGVDAANATKMALLQQGAAQADLNKQMQDWARQQDSALAQQKLANDLHGATTVEIIRQTAALRAQQEVEEVIRRAKERGSISPEVEADYRAKSRAASDAASNQNIRGAGLGAIDSLKKPGEKEDTEHANQLALLQAYRDQELADTVAANQAIERENERHERANFEMKMQGQQAVVSLMANSSDQLYSVLKQAGLEQTAIGKAAFLASKAMAVAQIILNTNVAASAAIAMPPLGLGPIAGAGLAATIKGMGYASAAMTAGLAIAEASAEGGYDIPGGVNPVTQLHEKEMVLPKAQAEVIRGLAARGGAGGGGELNQTINITIDGKTDMAENRKLVAMAVAQGNADLVDRLQRAERI